jgi:predicted ester cyclase
MRVFNREEVQMKRAVLFLLLSVVSVSPALSAETAEKRKAVARRVFEEIFNQGKFEVADQIYAKDFVNHGVTRDLKSRRAAFPDLKTQVDKVLVDGEFVTVLWSGEGTNTGEGNGLPATGKKLKGSGITIWRISGGKIREEWSEFDQLRILQQLGLMPVPPE